MSCPRIQHIMIPDKAKPRNSKMPVRDYLIIKHCFFLHQSDLATRPVEKEAIDRMCRENAFLGWTEMSVKEDINVTETMA